MNATTKTPTHAEAVTAFDSVLESFKDSAPIDENNLLVAMSGMNRGIQIRDYVMGKTILELTGEDSASFFRFLIATTGETVGLYTLLSLAEYRAGNSKECQTALFRGAELDETYPLGQLLARVFSAGWSVESFETMAKELHPRVLEGLESLADVIAGEE